VTFETAFLASSMKFHPVHINLLYCIAVLKIRGVDEGGGNLCGGGDIFVDGEVDFHRLEFRVTALSHFLAVY
jgi:hypothetical protein